jgi:hypothetical protein
VDKKFVGGKILGNITIDLKYSNKIAQTNTWDQTLTNSQVLTDALKITWPGCTVSGMSCNPLQQGGSANAEPYYFYVYQDNLYGTFLFVPDPWYVQPMAQIVDTTTPSLYGELYHDTDSFTLTVTGPANQPITVAENGSAQSGSIGSTDVNGVFTTSGTWTSASDGSYAQTWYVGGVPSPTLTFKLCTKGSTGCP